MTIAACLAWWNEKPETLVRCVRSLAGVADHLVALDGAWEGYPEPVNSTLAEHAYIAGAASEAGITCRVLDGPDEGWLSQVSKRSTLMELGAETGADWLLVIDADEWIETCDPDGLRAALAATDLDVARVSQRVMPERSSSFVRPRTRLFRANVGVTLEHAHNGYVTADGRWLYGDPRHVTLDPHLDVLDLVMLGHDVETARTPDRLRARRDFLTYRKGACVEAWPEAVPA